MDRTDLEESDHPRRLTRRRFIAHAGLGTTAFALGLTRYPRPASAAPPNSQKPADALLEKSPFVYVSPLLTDDRESSCHAELWYAWLDESVVVTVASERWKAKALALGHDRARIWVGDHGRWKTWTGGKNEAFREAPNFIARAEKVTDATMIDRLLEVYGKKYPREIDAWRDKMRSGNADGTRILIRYRPT